MSKQPNLSDFAHKVDVSQCGGDYRSAGRQLTLQFLHHLTVQGEEAMGHIAKFLAETTEDPRAVELAKEWILGTWRHRQEFDDLIQSASTHWDINRMNLVDRNNLRLGLYQLFYCREIPPSVVLNEAVELAKKFSTAQAPGFVNAILDSLRQKAEVRNADEESK